MAIFILLLGLWFVFLRSDRKSDATVASVSAEIRVDIGRENHPISPLIYGLSGADAEYLRDLNIPYNSWGGNTSTRYNWHAGNAWNAGRDWEYRNVNYAQRSGNIANDYLATMGEMGVATRLAIPTLGWVAKDSDRANCSFPQADGECGYGRESECDNQHEVADPYLTSIRSTPEHIAVWMRHIRDAELPVNFIAMDNEPELWGYTHYDVHPDCTTYAEILDKYLSYATVVREILPDVALTGPTTCCWTYYWNSAAGRLDKWRHDNQDFLPWFLDQVRAHDEAVGVRHLDVLDIHYYPVDLFEAEVEDEATQAHRLRATASLWDENYVAESWIDEPIYLIPRMQALLDTHYPDTKLGISEWNFGADETLNGALAIADVLGIFGKYGLDFANYWMFPAVDSHGYQAFKAYTNVDGAGTQFGDVSVFAETDAEHLAVFAATDSASGDLHVMVINKSETVSAETTLLLPNFTPSPITHYQYDHNGWSQNTQTTPTLTIPPYSINHLIIQG